MKKICENEKQIPVLGEFDVIVCGGGASGFPAAIAAAQEEVNVLLVEHYGFLGGTATAAMMVEFGSSTNGKRLLSGGVVVNFLRKMAASEGSLADIETLSMTFNPEYMILLVQELLIEAGVELLLHTHVCDVIMEGNTVNGIIVENKSGRGAYLAKTIIDATGDGDVAVQAGAGFDIGRPQDGKMQPISLEIMVGGVDSTKVQLDDKLLSAIKEASVDDWPIPTERVFSWGEVPKPGAPADQKNTSYFINATNVIGIDGTNAEDLTRAEIESRRQVNPLVKFLKNHAIGFEKCYLERVACQVGIRETRRIKGKYCLTADDVLQARHFPDGIVPAYNNIDVHDVDGLDFEHYFLKPGTHYQIPYRSLLPETTEGLIMAGRAISIDHRALGSARVMCITMPIGEAAGIAAALCVKDSCLPSQLPAEKIRKRMKAIGYVIDEI
jgi:FAD-dependent oxidoreductase family protein